jgi:hypothetical protein
MNWLLKTGLLAGTSVLLTVGGLDAQTAVIGEGARVYAQNCARCHNLRSPTERSSRDWATIVLHMRARGNLTRTEGNAVRAFLEATNRQDDAPLAQPPASGPEDAANQDEDGEATRKKSNGTGTSPVGALQPHPRPDLDELSRRYIRMLSNRQP